MASYFPPIDDVMSTLQCKSKLNKQIRIIVVSRAGKINDIEVGQGQSQCEDMVPIGTTCSKDHSCQILMFYL